MNYSRFTHRITLALTLLILCSVQARGTEDKIVFISKRNFTPEVFLVEGLDGRPIQLTRNMFASWPSISPDGTEIVFVSRQPGGPSNIFKLHIARRRIEKLTHTADSDIQYRYLDWSPDGRKLLYIMSLATPAGEKNELRVMDMKTRDIRRVLQLVFPILIFNPSWSPDNEHILFHQGNLGAHHLLITDDSGNSIVDVLQDDGVFTPAWSPSRHQIAYIDFIVTKPVPPNPYQIYSMNLAQERVTALTSGGTKSRIPLAWRQDGRKILFAYQNIFSRFDKEIKSGDIYVMNADGANMINLTQTTQKEDYASWSPDGKHIAFDRWLSEEESSIFVMDANGRNTRRLTFEPGINGAPHWSPDGNRIAFLSIWDGGRGIYTMDREGNNIKQITHGQRKFDGAPAWSPHGKWIAFGSGDEGSWGLYLIDPQGHNEMPIIRSKVSQLDSRAMLRPTWSPDSQNLIYVDPEADDDVGLMMIRTDGGLPTQLNTDGLKHWLGPAWSPDGNSLLFSAIKERGLILPEVEFVLYLMNLNGSERSEFILPIKSDWPVESRMALTRLVWAPDGSQLMLSIEAIEAIGRLGREKRLYLIDIATESIKLWMDDAAEADWVRPGFVYAVNPSGKRISTWAELKKTVAH